MRRLRVARHGAGEVVAEDIPALGMQGSRPPPWSFLFERSAREAPLDVPIPAVGCIKGVLG